MNDADRRRTQASVLTLAVVYGLLHAVVDGACAALLASLKLERDLSADRLWTLFLLYNGLAFALQLPLGAMADLGRKYAAAMLAGTGLVCLGVLPWVPSIHGAIGLIGLGNAAFHVGAGAMVLRISPDRAAAAGLFVAPGSLGLAAGGWCGPNLAWWPWLGVIVLAASAAGVVLLQPAAEQRVTTLAAPLRAKRSIVRLAVVLLLASVAVRSTVGMAVGAAYESQGSVLLGLAWAGFFGKALGGLIADRLGWIKTSIAALALSAPFLLLDRTAGTWAVAGVFLFQMTMPVTLLAVYRAFPEEPGLAFGLPTLALFIGSLPVYVLPVAAIAATPILLALIAISLICLLIGLPLILRTAVKVELSKREENVRKLRCVTAENERLRRHIDGMQPPERP